MSTTTDPTTRLLTLIHTHPGKDALALREFGLTPRDGRLLRELEKAAYVVFKSGGWLLTSKGDVFLLENTKTAATS